MKSALQFAIDRNFYMRSIVLQRFIAGLPSVNRDIFLVLSPIGPFHPARPTLGAVLP
jgi:hypothetical protein